MEGRRSAEETSRHGPMLDTAPENIGALQCRGNACSRYRLGAERSEVGTVCVKRASTGLYGGQPGTAVPTATVASCAFVFASNRIEKILSLLMRARIFVKHCVVRLPIGRTDSVCPKAAVLACFRLVGRRERYHARACDTARVFPLTPYRTRAGC